VLNAQVIRICCDLYKHSTGLCSYLMPSSHDYVKLGNGKVVLPYGSAEYIGLGFSVLCFLVVIELL